MCRETQSEEIRKIATVWTSDTSISEELQEASVAASISQLRESIVVCNIFFVLPYLMEAMNINEGFRQTK